MVIMRQIISETLPSLVRHGELLSKGPGEHILTRRTRDGKNALGSPTLAQDDLKLPRGEWYNPLRKEA